MKCKNCGFPKHDHIAIAGEFGSRIVWQCPNGAGTAYPVTIDVRVELHYQAGEDSPWIAKWVHPTTGAGEVVSRQPVEAIELAGREIEKRSEEPLAAATTGAKLE